MPSLIKAFKRMSREGLIARREYYCPDCAPEAVLEVAERWRRKGKEVRGFVHLDELDLTGQKEGPAIGLAFGTVTADGLQYEGSDAAEVGRVVRKCLKAEGIRHSWDGRAGSQVLLKAEPALSGAPTKPRPAVEEMKQNFCVTDLQFGSEAMDQVADNPVRLLNRVKLAQLDFDPVPLRGPLWEPRVGDHVQLAFFVGDAMTAAGKTLEEAGLRLGAAHMWVEVTGIEEELPQRIYRGELGNRPVLMDPAKLRYGSPVKFTQEHVYCGMRPTENGEGGPGA
jgi:hypothetical protein